MNKPMKTISLDAIDRKILKYLVKNARMPFLEIARECGISGAAIHQRIHKLTEAGVILGSYMVVDPKMLGFDVCAHINISLKDPQQLQQVKHHSYLHIKMHGQHFAHGTVWHQTFSLQTSQMID